MGDIDGYFFEQEPIEKTQLFSTYTVQKDGMPFKSRIFRKEAIQRFSLETVMEYNKEVFWYMSKYSHMLALKQFSVYESGEVQYFENYEHSLKEYIDKKPIDEKESIEILKDILTAIHNMFTEGYYPLNIRPEHFVYVKNKWKLKSVVFEQESDKYLGLKSEYIWDPSRQAPEAFEKILSDSQLEDSLVWDIGSIMYNIYKSEHQLTTLQKILKISQNGPNLDRMADPALANIIKKSLVFDKQKRMKLLELFQNPIWRGCFDTKALRANIEASMSKISTLRFKAEMSKVREKSILQKSLQNQSSFNRDFMKKENRVSDKHEQLGQSQDFIYLLSGDLSAVSNVRPGNQAGDFGKKPPILESQSIKKSGKVQESADFALLINSIQFPGQQQQPLQAHKKNIPQLSPQKERQFLIKYKQEIDKVDLCNHVCELIKEIPFKTLKEYWQITAKFTLQFQAVIRMRKLVLSLNSESNIFDFNQQEFEAFTYLQSYTKLKELCNDLFEKRKKALHNFRIIAQQIKISDFVEMKDPQSFKKILESQTEQMTVEKFKPFLKRVMSHCYAICLEHYNQTRNSYMVFLNMYFLLVVSLDKIFIAEKLKENWGPLYNWQNKEPGSELELRNILDYMDKADRQILRTHLWGLASRWFQLGN